jgi:hypothetical protein
VICERERERVAKKQETKLGRRRRLEMIADWERFQDHGKTRRQNDGN